MNDVESDHNGTFVDLSPRPQFLNCSQDQFTPRICITHGPVSRLRGGHDSDSDEGPSLLSSYLHHNSCSQHSDEESHDETASSSKRKRKTAPTRPRKSQNKGKGKARADSDSDTEFGIRVTLGKGKQKGMYINEVIPLDSAPEFWVVPPADYPTAYLVDLSDWSECLESRGKTYTIDAFIKKQAH